MILFETAYREKYDYYERVFNTETNKSEVNKIQLPQEWFEEHSSGDYKSILDDSIKLKRLQGSSKNAREQWGFIDPIYRNIRESYWEEGSKGGNYNQTPRTFFLDIETRVGQSFVYTDKKVKIRKKL